METVQVPLWRLASRLHAAQSSYHSPDGFPFLEAVSNHLAEVARLTRQLRLCRRRGWTLAEKAIVESVTRCLRDVQGSAQLAGQALLPTAIAPSGIRAAYGELCELADEFESVAWSRDDRSLAVTTEPNTLEGVPLGPFQIRIPVDRLMHEDDPGILRIVAVSPHPCRQDSTVTHPHVSSERLCAGDGTAAIQAALRTGRWCDAMIMARSILRTYNVYSAYCTLEDWFGRPCHDCGYTPFEDEAFFCDGCQRDFCDECRLVCSDCGTSGCRDCLAPCPSCEEYTCSDCMETCEACRACTCAACLDDGLCPTCQESINDKEESEDALQKECQEDNAHGAAHTCSEPEAQRSQEAQAPV